MSEPHLVVLTRVPDAVTARLRARARVTDVSDLPRAQWGAALADADGVLAGSSAPLDASFFAEAPALRIVAMQSVGYDNVDLAVLRARGIMLTNSRGSLDEAVADTAYWLVVAAMRGFGRALAWVRSGRWLEQPDAPYGHDIGGATLGIVGLGAIGTAVARRAHAGGMNVIYSNRRPREDDAQTGASYRTFDALLAQADCIVLLVPLTPQTRGLFDDAAFAKMKPTATLVNAARGAVVDTAALLRALDRRTIAGAALDVTDPEPIAADHPLQNRDDVLITPHMGSATFETRTRMAMYAAENLLAYVDGEPPKTPVAL
ncbi:MAG: D-glycerate dehydrogenase [Candidatus Elarobacter sp.]